MRQLLLLSLLLICACGSHFWDSVYRSESPEVDAAVEVQVRKCLGDCELRIVLERRWRSTEIAKGNDCHVAFAHAAWSGNVVSVFVDGTICRELRIAYDVAAEQSVPFEETESWLAASIIEEYSVTSEELAANNGDVFAWAIYSGHERPRRSHAEFGRRYYGWKD